jgi:nicotinate-nucleotide adenylyltransferase
MSDLLGQKPNRGADLRRLGIFGGTFDPVHLGHLICAEQLRQALDLDLVLFVPSNEPPHKPSTMPAKAEHRLDMLRIAIEGHQSFRDSDLEIRRGGVSYTIDTVLELRESVKRKVEFWLLMGQDSYQDVANWKEPDRIAAECFFGVACRPGYGRKPKPPVPAARATFVDITAVDVSSTDIRTRLNERRSIRYLVPLKVEDYIRANGVYSQEPAG